MTIIEMFKGAVTSVMGKKEMLTDWQITSQDNFNSNAERARLCRHLQENLPPVHVAIPGISSPPTPIVKPCSFTYLHPSPHFLNPSEFSQANTSQATIQLQSTKPTDQYMHSNTPRSYIVDVV